MNMYGVYKVDMCEQSKSMILHYQNGIRLKVSGELQGGEYHIRYSVILKDFMS